MLKKKVNLFKYNEIIAEYTNNRVNTICTNLFCPNLIDCYNQKNLTLSILEGNCTRNCKYCTGNKLGNKFYLKTAINYLKKRKIKNIVISSITRDDLYDSGASIFIQTISELKKIKNIFIDVLIPDFFNKSKNETNFKQIKKITELKPDIIGHNIETTKNLYKKIRPECNYDRAINILRKIKEFNIKQITKSAIILGLGEDMEELFNVLKNIKDSGVDYISIGQYFKNPLSKLKVKKYYSEKEFKKIENYCYSLKFKKVSCNTYSRYSSTLAKI